MFHLASFILGPRFASFGECSNPCTANPRIELLLNVPQGIRVSECRWNENGTCVDISEPCHGSRDWVILDTGVSDHEKCIASKPAAVVSVSTLGRKYYETLPDQPLALKD